MGFKTAPFLGKGISWPFRLNKNTGSVQVTEGQYDPVSVAAAWIAEKWQIRTVAEDTANHVAEAIYHILFTSRFEHETLPEFFSKIQYALFEPNSPEFRLMFTAYLQHAVEKWEPRAKYPKFGVQWYQDGVATDRGELPLVAQIEFITQQHPRNMVAPFVSVRQARTEYYPASVIDNNGHDLVSRYYRRTAYQQGDFKYIRLMRNINIPPAQDDLYYMVKPLDTWMLIAHVNLYDVRYWFYPYLCYIQDKALEGGTRDILNPNIEPTPGDIIRLPSRERILLINSWR
jgi:phage baseplate assembly protein W